MKAVLDTNHLISPVLSTTSYENAGFQSVPHLLVWISHPVILHPLTPHLRRECALSHVIPGFFFGVEIPKCVDESLRVISEPLWRHTCVIVVGDSNQDEDVESRNLLEIAVAAELAALSKLFDRWHCVPILFFEVLVRWIFGKRTIDELAEVFPPLMVFPEIL